MQRESRNKTIKIKSFDFTGNKRQKGTVNEEISGILNSHPRIISPDKLPGMEQFG